MMMAALTRFLLRRTGVTVLDRLVREGENLDGRVLLAAHGHRRWRAQLLPSPHPLRQGYGRADVVYALHPLGRDTHGFGGVKRIVRSENELIAWGWLVVG